MSDQEVFNTLERAISGDINDLQALATRQMADQLQFLLATRLQSQTGGADDTLPQSATGGLAIRPAGGGTQVQLLTGFLAQFSNTWPAVPGALESAMRLGYNRSPLTITLSATPLQAVLLEARVVDVVTLNTVRDVFDIPTQTFIPTAIDKRIERQIETLLTEAATPLIPGYSGDPWVPLYAFLTDAGGLADLTSTLLHDFRPDMQDILQGSDQTRGIYSNSTPEGVVEQAALQTARPGVNGDTAFASIGGDFAGRIGDISYRFRNAASGLLPISAAGFVLANDTIAHVYLLPLAKGALGIAPWNGGASSTIKGALHLSDVQPANGGRVNSAPITPNAALYGNFEAVPAGRAMYVGSVYGGTAGGLRYMTQSGGGRVVLASPNPGNPLFEVSSFSGALVPGSSVENVNLAGIIPDAARVATLVINCAWGSAAGDVLLVSPQAGPVTFGNAGVTATMKVQAPVGGTGRSTMVVDVPVFFQGTVDNADKFVNILLVAPSAGNVVITVDCIGWEL